MDLALPDLILIMPLGGKHYSLSLEIKKQGHKEVG